MASLIRLMYSAAQGRRGRVSGLAAQQFNIEDGVPITPCGPDICFHQTAYLEIPNSVTSHLSALTTAPV